MNWMDGFNRVVDYIETHLEEEMDYQATADILGYSAYHFQRLFILISGVSLAEYIRCRRLSRAAEDLTGGTKVVDVAFKYGYSSPNSFQRAFKAMHGVSPAEVKKTGATMKAFPPLSFELKVKGADLMDYRIVEMDEFRIVGKKLHTTMENGECYQKLPAFWGELMEGGGQGEILALMDREPMGLLGVSDYNPELDSSAFDYYIAVSSGKDAPQGMEEMVVPGATWAVFPCAMGEAGAIQGFQQRIVLEWLPSSGYEFGRAPDVEVYGRDGMMETWIPVVKVR